jgi:hypothetical protein
LLKTGCPQDGQSTFISTENNSTSPLQLWRFLIFMTGVPLSQNKSR